MPSTLPEKNCWQLKTQFWVTDYNCKIKKKSHLELICDCGELKCQEWFNAPEEDRTSCDRSSSAPSNVSFTYSAVPPPALLIIHESQSKLWQWFKCCRSKTFQAAQKISIFQLPSQTRRPALEIKELWFKANLSLISLQRFPPARLTGIHKSNGSDSPTIKVKLNTTRLLLALMSHGCGLSFFKYFLWSRCCHLMPLPLFFLRFSFLFLFLSFFSSLSSSVQTTRWTNSRSAMAVYSFTETCQTNSKSPFTFLHYRWQNCQWCLSSENVFSQPQLN